MPLQALDVQPRASICGLQFGQASFEFGHALRYRFGMRAAFCLAAEWFKEAGAHCEPATEGSQKHAKNEKDKFHKNEKWRPGIGGYRVALLRILQHREGSSVNCSRWYHRNFHTCSRSHFES